MEPIRARCGSDKLWPWLDGQNSFWDVVQSNTGGAGVFPASVGHVFGLLQNLQVK